MSSQVHGWCCQSLVAGSPNHFDGTLYLEYHQTRVPGPCHLHPLLQEHHCLITYSYPLVGFPRYRDRAVSSGTSQRLLRPIKDKNLLLLPSCLMVNTTLLSNPVTQKHIYYLALTVEKQVLFLAMKILTVTWAIFMMNLQSLIFNGKDK